MDVVEPRRFTVSDVPLESGATLRDVTLAFETYGRLAADGRNAIPVTHGRAIDMVNLGNMMKRWSNDRFLSTPHGVLNDTGTDRYSTAFFYSPNVDAVIECLPSCVGPGNPPRYEPAVYRDLVLDFCNANYFHRRAYTGRRAG